MNQLPIKEGFTFGLGFMLGVLFTNPLPASINIIQFSMLLLLALVTSSLAWLVGFFVAMTIDELWGAE